MGGENCVGLEWKLVVHCPSRNEYGSQRRSERSSSSETKPLTAAAAQATARVRKSAGIGARFRQRMEEARAEQAARADGRPLGREDRASLKVLGLGVDADRRALRARYAELVRKYHPDRNGGDRSHEKALQDVIAAYTQLKSAPAFA